MYNKATLIGRLVKDPDVRYTPSGIPVARFTVAINRPVRNKENKPMADFIRVVAWRRLAEICSQYIFKGKLIAVEGRLQVEKYERSEGQKESIYEVVADNIQMLDKKPPSEEGMAKEELVGTEEQ